MLKRNIKTDSFFLKKEISLLKSVPELNLFSKRQQKLMIVSLYLSYRSLRKSTTKSFERVKLSDPYYTTANFIDIWFCHASVRAIVEQNFSEELLFLTPDSFFEANYTKNKVQTVQSATNLFEKAQMPSIVHLAQMEKNKYGPIHSFIALGKNQNGEIITWEKEAAYLPFKVSTISLIHAYYPSQYWGIKPFFPC